jgi:hypothetical protein
LNIIIPSDIVPPEFDAFGQLRVPDTDNPPGGGSVIDRGALDRADRVGVNAFLLQPRDNDAEGLDRDPTISVVQRPDGIFTEFLIQLNDGASTRKTAWAWTTTQSPGSGHHYGNSRRMIRGPTTFFYDRRTTSCGSRPWQASSCRAACASSRSTTPISFHQRPQRRASAGRSKLLRDQQFHHGLVRVATACSSNRRWNSSSSTGRHSGILDRDPSPSPWARRHLNSA